MIEKLVRTGYAWRKGRKIIITEAGERLISVLPGTLKSPSLTSAWENRLLLIEEGKADKGKFMEDIIQDVKLMTDYLNKSASSETGKFSTDSWHDRSSEISKEDEIQASSTLDGRKSVLKRLHRNEAIVAAHNAGNLAERPLAREIGVR